MKWDKLGILWNTDGRQDWSRSHAMAPTPVRLDRDTVRVYVTTRDATGRGRPTYLDVSARDPMQVFRTADHPLLDLGQAGSFDEHGVVMTSLVCHPDGRLMMYYSGFEPCQNIRYRVFTGLAWSEDHGETFRRHSRAPILDRSHDELYFRCSPCVLYEHGLFRLWYVAGSSWTELNGKLMPVYDLRHQVSHDGITWTATGQTVLTLNDAVEHGFGRPWVVKHGEADYRLFYSIRRRDVGAYRLGYATSRDGIHWIRKDHDMGLDTSPGGFDSEAIMYSATLDVDGRTYCFYNGNNFGEAGIGVAERIA